MENFDKVVLTVTMENGKLLVIMDDFHELIQDVPIKSQRGAVLNYKKDHATVQSQVTLEPEDAERFFKLTNIEE